MFTSDCTTCRCSRKTHVSVIGLEKQKQKQNQPSREIFCPFRTFLAAPQRGYTSLRDLEITSGTGPAFSPARILKTCALLQLCATEVCLHTCLHKLFCRENPFNYRRIHLTPHISKAIEPAFATTLMACLGKRTLGGGQQAYTRQRSQRNVLAMNVCNWLLLLESDFAVGLFRSDVCGTFDRVRRACLCKKSWFGLQLRGIFSTLSLVGLCDFFGWSKMYLLLICFVGRPSPKISRPIVL